jgi:hypothetical protein
VRQWFDLTVMDILPEKKDASVATVKSLPEYEVSHEIPSPQIEPSEFVPIASPAARPVSLPSAEVMVGLDKPALERSIENVLEEDLAKVYWDLPEAERENFKNQGVETATKIRELLSQAVVKAQDVFGLIMIWLKSLPGVSQFFIEQEAKNKTAKIMKLKQ